MAAASSPPSRPWTATAAATRRGCPSLSCCCCCSSSAFLLPSSCFTFATRTFVGNCPRSCGRSLLLQLLTRVLLCPAQKILHNDPTLKRQYGTAAVVDARLLLLLLV